MFFRGDTTMIFQNKKAQTGFTLLELIIVIAIIGITAIAAMPKFKQMESTMDMDSAQRIILSTINACSRLSKVRNRDVYLVMKPQDEKMEVYIDEDQDNAYTDEQKYMVRTLPKRINLAGVTNITTDYVYKFNSHGTVQRDNGDPPGSIHYAPKDVPYAAGQESKYRTIIPSNMTQKPRYYKKGGNTPFPAFS
ncbi:MAG: prepilin-type N-terminal cleavage/methylation domain-containing protein [Candidatus Hydrogenedentota bacterium]